MSDVKCPYCGTEQEINHDDGYGYDEDMTHEQMCIFCKKDFKFMTSISYDYEVYCDGGHEMEHRGYRGLWDCRNCDYYEVRHD